MLAQRATGDTGFMDSALFPLTCYLETREKIMDPRKVIVYLDLSFTAVVAAYLLTRLLSAAF
jgi:hypothetical protein